MPEPKRIQALMPQKKYRDLMAALKVRAVHIHAQTGVTAPKTFSAWLRDSADGTIAAFPASTPIRK